MRLNGWMTKTPLSSCRMHSFSTAISLPYTYRDCLFSCGRSKALHPQVAVVHPAVGPFSFSMVRPGSPMISHRPCSLCCCRRCCCCCCFFCSGQVESDSTSPDLPSWSQGNFPSRLPTSGLLKLRGVRRVDTRLSTPSLSLRQPLSISAPTPSLHSFSFSPSSSTIQYLCLIPTWIKPRQEGKVQLALILKMMACVCLCVCVSVCVCACVWMGSQLLSCDTTMTSGSALCRGQVQSGPSLRGM